MSSTLITSSIVAKATLAVLENSVGFSQNVNTEWTEEFTGNMSRGYAPGSTILIQRPPRYQYRAGRVAVPQATVQSTVPLTLSQGGCDFNFTGYEKTLSMPTNKFEDAIAAAVAPVVNEIDRQGLALAHYSTFNALNPAGTLPTTQALALDAVTGLNRRLDEMAAPRDSMRTMINNPALNASMIQGFAGLFNGQATITKQFQRGMMVDSLGIAYAMDQNVDVHTNGTQSVAGTNVSGAGQTGAAITVVGLGGTITRGTVVTFPGVFAVNPQSRTSTGVLAQFVVTADLAAAATSIPISPAIVTSGAFQNATASPTNGSPFLIVGAASTSYATNVAYHKDAFTLAMVPMNVPTGVGVEVHQETHKGMTVKVTRGYDIINDNNIWRLDVLFGWAATYPELSCKYYTLN
jgi:P22 coat protein - gene protein 5